MVAGVCPVCGEAASLVDRVTLCPGCRMAFAESLAELRPVVESARLNAKPAAEGEGRDDGDETTAGAD